MSTRQWIESLVDEYGCLLRPRTPHDGRLVNGVLERISAWEWDQATDDLHVTVLRSNTRPKRIILKIVGDP